MTLWALPSPQTILNIGSNKKFFHRVNDSESYRLLLQGFRINIEMQIELMNKVKILILFDQSHKVCGCYPVRFSCSLTAND